MKKLSWNVTLNVHHLTTRSSSSVDCVVMQPPSGAAPVSCFLFCKSVSTVNIRNQLFSFTGLQIKFCVLSNKCRKKERYFFFHVIKPYLLTYCYICVSDWFTHRNHWVLHSLSMTLCSFYTPSFPVRAFIKSFRNHHPHEALPSSPQTLTPSIFHVALPPIWCSILCIESIPFCRVTQIPNPPRDKFLWCGLRQQQPIPTLWAAHWATQQPIRDHLATELSGMQPMGVKMMRA